MVKDCESQLDTTFAALADPTRRAILLRLRGQSLRVTEVAEPLPISLAATSKHVKVLEQAGLITRTVRGRDHWLTLNAGPLAKAAEWISAQQRFWEANLSVLSSFLGEPAGGRLE